MRKVAVFSVLLLLGMAGSQVLPGMVGPSYASFAEAVQVATMVALSFIMIHVGYEFEIERDRLRQYGWDYVVAMTAAAFPWVFCCLYFVFVMMPPAAWASWQAWREALISSRFAAPTSAGVLFSMLAAAGLSATWLFRKARILAIFDDLDTVLLMIPLRMIMIGVAWQLGFMVVVMGLLLWLGWRFLHAWRIPSSWPWVLLYSVVIAGVSELVYVASQVLDYRIPIHLEVLLPAFVLGGMMARPAGMDPHRDDPRDGHQEGPESPGEQHVATLVSAVFMVLVGLSMPPALGDPAPALPPSTFPDAANGDDSAAAPAEVRPAQPGESYTASLPMPGWPVLALHVLALTLLANLGKMFPALCYRREASWRERLAVAIGLWPRGEVGAGVLILSLSYGIGGPIVTVAMLCLALNLCLTGVFILMIKRLVAATTATG